MKTKNSITKKEKEGMRISSNSLIISLILFGAFVFAGVLLQTFTSTLQMSILGEVLILAGAVILLITGVFMGIVMLIKSSYNAETVFTSISVSSVFGTLLVSVLFPSLVLISGFVVISAIAISGSAYIFKELTATSGNFRGVVSKA